MDDICVGAGGVGGVGGVGGAGGGGAGGVGGGGGAGGVGGGGGGRADGRARGGGGRGRGRQGGAGGGGGDEGGKGMGRTRQQLKGHWCGTLNNPTPAELKDLWVFNQPHGPVPSPPYPLGYIIIGAEHFEMVGQTPHLQIYLELQGAARVSSHFLAESLISCVNVFFAGTTQPDEGVVSACSLGATIRDTH